MAFSTGDRESLTISESPTVKKDWKDCTIKVHCDFDPIW